MINIDYLIENLISIRESDSPECVWRIDDDCNDTVLSVRLFDQQVGLTICPKHLAGHVTTMGLHTKGIDIEEIMEMDLADKEQKFVDLYGTGTVDRAFCQKLTNLSDSEDDESVALAASKALNL